MPRTPKPRTGDPTLDQAIIDLVGHAGVSADVDIVIEMVANAVKMGRDGHDRGDLKIVNQALRELRNSYRAFGAHRAQRKCSVFGSARTQPDEPAYAAAVEVGRELAARGWMIITGGGPGIMTAAVQGAGRDNSYAVTIRLPFEPMEGGGIVAEERMVRFRYFFTRKLTFMKESSAYICFPGGFGTMDETFELLTLIQTGKEPPAPVVLIAPPGDRYWALWRDFVHAELIDAGLVSDEDLDLVHLTDSPAAAAAYVDAFYRQFHSLRYVDGRLVLRLERPVTDDELDRLNRDFADIVVSGRIERSAALAAEVEDDDEVDRPRLLLDFDHHHFSRLHQLIRAL